MSEERLDRDGRLKLPERITQIEVGPDAAAPVVDFNEHDAQTCPVCNQVAAEITAFVHAAALASVSAEKTFARTRCARLSTNL
jgi:hypothetical protein